MDKKIIPDDKSKLTRWERFWNELQWLYVVAAILAVFAIGGELSRRGYW